MDAASVFDREILHFFGATLGRIGHASPKRKLAFLGSLAFQRRQAILRARAAREGRTVPPILIASVTRKCNLDCVGCYSKALRPAGDALSELSDDRLMELFEEAVGLGVGTIMIAGGEPLLRKPLLERVAALRGPLIPVFTNGTMVDEDFMELFASGSLLPVFSIEGEAASTAKRRGGGIHEAVIARAAALRARGALFGFSLTLSSENASTALSKPFLDYIGTLGPSVLFLIEYVPVRAGTESLVLDDAQKALVDDKARFAGLPYGVVSLPGDEEAHGGCLAAGRGFIHLSPEGRVEACPFAPYSDSETAAASLADALDSPLMRAIRERHAELTETKGGCALWNKRGWVASLGGCVSRGSGEGASALGARIPA